MKNEYSTQSKEYRKKPVIIEAYQTDKEIEIETLEGTMKANIGDFIITGIHGEQYPCKPDIFHETYDEVGNEEDLSIDSFVMDNLIEWSNILNELSKKEEKLLEYKETYNTKEFTIVYQSSIDFKTLYGSTSEKVRKQHAATELKELDDKIKSLELNIDYLKRRITYLKQLINTKTILIEANKK